ncbi:MAG: peptide deformylase [Lachnospiraceae bacterium]|nr:peptide deformylase [Lachnospiraceae bacterium]
MAVRNIREIGDEILRKHAKPVEQMTERVARLIEDMFDTMYEADGVGLAAPQVGILRRIFVVDTTMDESEPQRYVMINPEILEKDGEQEGMEGCLSVPGKHAVVKRANRVKVRAQDENMEWFELEAEGLLARAIQHEYDHLDGIMYVDRAEGPVTDVEES